MSMQEDWRRFRTAIDRQNTKQAFRWAFASDFDHGLRVLEHEVHTQVAEYRLSTDGIKPELLRYIEGLRRAYGNA